MYRDPPPVRQMAHYEVGLEKERLMQPGDFGLVNGLEIPLSMESEPAYRVNLSLALYKTALVMGADMLEVENHEMYPPGTQDNFKNFLEYHTLKYGWEYPRAMNISWAMNSPDFRGNMVCVASKYDGVTDVHEPDTTVLGKEGVFIKERGVSLGVDSQSDIGTFSRQFCIFEPLFHAALLRSCRTAGAKVRLII